MSNARTHNPALTTPVTIHIPNEMVEPFKDAAYRTFSELIPKELFVVGSPEAKKYREITKEDAAVYALMLMVDSLANTGEFKTLAMPMIPVQLAQDAVKLALSIFESVARMSKDQLDLFPPGFSMWVDDIKRTKTITLEDFVSLLILFSGAGAVNFTPLSAGQTSPADNQIDLLLNQTMTPAQIEKIRKWANGKEKKTPRKMGNTKRNQKQGRGDSKGNTRPNRRPVD